MASGEESGCGKYCIGSADDANMNMAIILER